LCSLAASVAWATGAGRSEREAPTRVGTSMFLQPSTTIAGTEYSGRRDRRAREGAVADTAGGSLHTQSPCGTTGGSSGEARVGVCVTGQRPQNSLLQDAAAAVCGWLSAEGGGLG